MKLSICLFFACLCCACTPFAFPECPARRPQPGAYSWDITIKYHARYLLIITSNVYFLHSRARFWYFIVLLPIIIYRESFKHRYIFITSDNWWYYRIYIYYYHENSRIMPLVDVSAAGEIDSFFIKFPFFNTANYFTATKEVSL